MLAKDKMIAVEKEGMLFIQQTATVRNAVQCFTEIRPLTKAPAIQALQQV